jgi:mono/diheme cytochrome c family protein
MIPPSGYLRRVIMTMAIAAVPLMLGLILSYDVLKLNWRSTMEIQPSFRAQEGPRKSAPNDAVRFDGPSLSKTGELAQNPVPADAISLQRGQELYNRNCALCHGEGGLGNGPITQYWKPEMKKPANLTEQRISTASDGTIYLTIAQGFGAMPPLSENVNVRERWDIVNYVKTLGK